MDELQKQIILLFSIPIYALIIPLEILMSNFRHLNFYSWRETMVNIYLNILNAGVDMVVRLLFAFVVLNFFYKYHLAIEWHPIAYWLVLLIGEDFLFWLEHLVDHSSRLFWAVHVTHHSSPEYNLSTGFRSSVFMPLYKYFYFIPLALLNFRPMDILFMFSITQIYGILVHTQAIKKLPKWVGYIFVTPAHHRVHHASNIEYLDRNMGMVFIVWDRIFGTFTDEDDQIKTKFGITKPIATPYHPIKIVTHEWADLAKDLKKAPTIRDKFNYLFRAPGWSHDGSAKTTKQLQKELELAKKG